MAIGVVALLIGLLIGRAILTTKPKTHPVKIFKDIQCFSSSSCFIGNRIHNVASENEG
ncbi:MAG: hypothetical protein QW579_06890 [Desulfurococcaceae archaeon]